MTTFEQAIKDHRIRCLLRAQDSLAKARSNGLDPGFDQPDEVALEVQAIMVKIPSIIKRLEKQPELAGAVPTNT